MSDGETIEETIENGRDAIIFGLKLQKKRIEIYQNLREESPYKKRAGMIAFIASIKASLSKLCTRSFKLSGVSSG
jgi:hypothetical protein